MTGVSISIITPVFNGRDFISACIHNVISQNVQGLEHLIMDGGSTDGTVDILSDYSARYAHIRVLSEKDNGQSDAMNKALRLASSEIVGFLNVDDFYEPEAVNSAISFLRKHPGIDFVAGNCRVIDANGKEESINRPTDLRLESLLLGWEFAQYPINPSAYFYKKAIHSKVGDYDVAEHFAMDLSFILACAANVKMGYVPEIWGNFRSRPGAKTFEDRANGPARVKAIRERWINNLPLMRRAAMAAILISKRIRRKISHLTKAYRRKY